MKDTIKVSWYIILTTMVLWMFVVEATKVFAHGNGQCITDAVGDVFLRDGSYVKIDSHLSVDELAKKTKGRHKYGHGHKNQYYDITWQQNNPIYIVFRSFGLRWGR